MFQEISSEEVPDDITKVFPQHAFSNMMDTYILVKMRPHKIEDVMMNIKMVYEALKERESGFQLLKAQRRVINGTEQGMICYTTKTQDKKQYYMLAMYGNNDAQYLHLSCCPYSEKNLWKTHFYQILDSIELVRGEGNG